MYKKITKIPDFVFALIVIFIPISLIYIFFSPDFWQKEIISYWILAIIGILNFFVCFFVSLILTRLKVVDFSFIFYYTVILFSLTFLLLTYPLNSTRALLILRVILVLISIFLIIPSLIIKKKITNRLYKNKLKSSNK
ncbi:MAG3450 family membrane protein [Mesomycoplasma ovipneumoniae]|uniref:MAG3450 family membrane protein n=1 Tax=Mesomycoplasma ovipneumoniae TaxID=29562 RepID=UPI00311B14DA